jgi:hypothetical protein
VIAACARSKIPFVERFRRNTTIVLGCVTALLGLALIVATVASGGGATAIGIVFGAALAVLGSARVYLATGPHSHRQTR